MDFQFDVPPALRATQDRITTVTANTLLPPSSRAAQGRNWADLSKIIDAMGLSSASAQKLPQVITTAERLAHSNHRLYLLRDVQASGCVILGFIKVGEKKLFLYDDAGKLHEREPTCVLDFYVHESCQRGGFGRELFDHMLEAEGRAPWQLAIDRPSHKFLSFLDRHFQLSGFTKQSNNYVVFRKFFTSGAGNGPRRGDKKLQSRQIGTPSSTSQMTDYRSPVSTPSHNPPSRYSRTGTPHSQIKTSAGLSEALGFSPMTYR